MILFLQMKMKKMKKQHPKSPDYTRDDPRVSSAVAPTLLASVGILILMTSALVGCGRPSSQPESRTVAESSAQRVGLSIEESEQEAEIEAQIQAGLSLMRRGDLAGALLLFQSLLANYPHRSDLLLHIASIQEAQGQILQAEANYNSAIALNPTEPDAYVQRGQLLWEQRDPFRAQADFDYALRLDPQQPEVLQQRGRLHLEQANYEAALSDFEAAIQLDPRAADPHLGKADTLEALDRDQEAGDSLSDYLSLSRGHISDRERGEIFYRLVDIRREAPAN